MVNLSKVSGMVYLRCKYLAMTRARTMPVQYLHGYMQGVKISDPKNDMAAQLVFVSAVAMVSESCDTDLETMVEFEARLFETQAGEPFQKQTSMSLNGIDCATLLQDSTVEHSSAAILRRAIRERYLQYVQRARAIWSADNEQGVVLRTGCSGRNLEELSVLVRQGINVLKHLLKKLSPTTDGH
jgi:hypothetical protein